MHVCSVNGRPLMDYLVRKSSVSEKMIAELMFQLFDALAYLHSHTILHLDVRVSHNMHAWIKCVKQLLLISQRMCLLFTTS